MRKDRQLRRPDRKLNRHKHRRLRKEHNHRRLCLRLQLRQGRRQRSNYNNHRIHPNPTHQTRHLNRRRRNNSRPRPCRHSKALRPNIRHSRRREDLRDRPSCRRSILNLQKVTSNTAKATTGFIVTKVNGTVKYVTDIPQIAGLIDKINGLTQPVLKRFGVKQADGSISAENAMEG